MIKYVNCADNNFGSKAVENLQRVLSSTILINSFYHL